MLQVTPIFFTKFSKFSLFISTNKYKKYIVSKKTVLLATKTGCASHPIVDITKY